MLLKKIHHQETTFYAESQLLPVTRLKSLRQQQVDMRQAFILPTFLSFFLGESQHCLKISSFLSLPHDNPRERAYWTHTAWHDWYIPTYPVSKKMLLPKFQYTLNYVIPLQNLWFGDSHHITQQEYIETRGEAVLEQRYSWSYSNGATLVCAQCLPLLLLFFSMTLISPSGICGVCDFAL